jgi:hypothetical protein
VRGGRQAERRRRHAWAAADACRRHMRRGRRGAARRGGEAALPVAILTAFHSIPEWEARRRRQQVSASLTDCYCEGGGGGGETCVDGGVGEGSGGEALARLRFGRKLKLMVKLFLERLQL